MMTEANQKPKLVRAIYNFQPTNTDEVITLPEILNKIWLTSQVPVDCRTAYVTLYFLFAVRLSYIIYDIENLKLIFR